MSYYSPISEAWSTLIQVRGTQREWGSWEITLQTQQWPGRVWYYASLNQNACLILLDSEVIVCEQSRSEKHEKPDHLRLPASGWDPRPSLPSPRQRWRLGCLHWPLAHYLLREEGENKTGLQHASSIIFPEELRSGEAGEESKLFILGP